jgi:hypothetical protein
MPLAALVGASGMFDRSRRGRRYSSVRGEILGFEEDQQKRKHSPRMLPLIKSYSLGSKGDQIPS